jgi:hypothetical protein
VRLPQTPNEWAVAFMQSVTTRTSSHLASALIRRSPSVHPWSRCHSRRAERAPLCSGGQSSWGCLAFFFTPCKNLFAGSCPRTVCAVQRLGSSGRPVDRKDSCLRLLTNAAAYCQRYWPPCETRTAVLSKCNKRWRDKLALADLRCADDIVSMGFSDQANLLTRGTDVL